MSLSLAFLAVAVGIPGASLVHAGAPEAAFASKPIPGQYSSFVLAISHEAQFCHYLPETRECQAGAGMLGMVLHGLWPNRSDDPRHNYQYCELSREQTREWCSPAIDVGGRLSARTLDKLSDVMPGVLSCLYNHEWYAHGTCSGMSLNDYFMDSAELAARFRALPNFNRLVVMAAGRIVSRGQILQAIAADLGPRAQISVVPNCQKDKLTGRVRFAELNITLNRNNYWRFPDPSSLGPSGPALGPDGVTWVRDRGNCPDFGIEVAEPVTPAMAKRMAAQKADRRPPR